MGSPLSEFCPTCMVLVRVDLFHTNNYLISAPRLGIVRQRQLQQRPAEVTHTSEVGDRARLREQRSKPTYTRPDPVPHLA